MTDIIVMAMAAGAYKYPGYAEYGILFHDEAELQRFADLVRADQKERDAKILVEVEGYLVAAAAGSMSRNNSESLAAELLDSIAAIRAARRNAATVKAMAAKLD